MVALVELFGVAGHLNDEVKIVAPEDLRVVVVYDHVLLQLEVLAKVLKQQVVVLHVAVVLVIVLVE